MEGLTKVINTLKADSTSAAVFAATVVVTFTVCYLFMGRDDKKMKAKTAAETEPPRNFTLDQLKVRVCSQQGR